MTHNQEESTSTEHKVDVNAEARSTAPLSNMEPIVHDVSTKNISGAVQEFIAIVGAENISSRPEALRAHASTPWSPTPPSQSPVLIVYPHSTTETSAIMQICSKRQIPVTGFSGGTSFSDALTATRKGICVDFARMDKILAIHPEDMDVVVQPAVGWQDLNAVLEKHGLFFPPDPGPGAQIGGMVRTDKPG